MRNSKILNREILQLEIIKWIESTSVRLSIGWNTRFRWKIEEIKIQGESKVKGIKHDGVGFSIFLSKSAGLIKSSSVLFVWLTAKDFSSVAGPLTGTEDS